MRFLLLASVLSLAGSGAFAQSLLGQSQPGGGQALSTVSVPAPPPIVAAPSAPVAPQPQASLPPQGLVETPLPPPGAVQQSSLPPDNAESSQTPPAAPASTTAAPSEQAVSPSVAPATPSSPAPSASTPVSLPANDVAPVPDNKWVYGHVAELGVLNKVDGSTKTLMIPVGGHVVSGDLTVSVQACVVRPDSSLPNAAVFLSLQSTSGAATAQPVYRGWIVQSLPGVADAENADEAFRVVGCS